MRRRDARLARGQASDEDTDPGEDGEVAVDPPEPETGPELPVEEQQRLRVIAMFRRTLLFSQGAATALYDDQAVQDLDTLREIDDDMIRTSLTKSPSRTT